MKPVIIKSVATQPRPQIETLKFNNVARDILHDASLDLADAGGPDSVGAQDRGRVVAKKLLLALHPAERQKVTAFKEGETAALVFDGMTYLETDAPPDELPSEPLLQADRATRYYASRNQILQALVEERPFAYYVENDGKIVRLVGDFRKPKPVAATVATELAAARAAAIERSSHRGTLLGAHTEGPYYAVKHPKGQHSPAPSTLILTARWNPLNQPTHLLPSKTIIDELLPGDSLNFVLKYFRFATSDSYRAGTDAARWVPLIDLHDDGSVAMRMNVHRAEVERQAPEHVKQSFQRLLAAIEGAMPTEIVLTPERAIIIRNTQCFHGRDAIVDPRRLLIRMFGYSADAQWVLVQADPFIVKG
jgi:hypothetical protein